MDRHLEAVRRAELERLRRWFGPGQRILELGGGNGYQASLLAAWGCEVVSLDLADRPAAARQFYPVAVYDGESIPAPDAAFDRVFSSNVLEHVEALPRLLAEIRRVLRPTGLAVHVLPTAAWRIWTTLAHYAYGLAYLAGRRRPFPGVEQVPSVSRMLQRRGACYLLRRALFPGPHGVYPSAWAEVYYFSRRRWARLFRAHGFELVEVGDNGLFYTGYGLLPGLPLSARQRLARCLGSASRTFVLRKDERAEPCR
ncbi:MAG TPA: class I SAM-dependent methyltransferase [Thermodesulfobacteriota bacterium]|nr:class I SAM-dependent methyltransferase [Thermodesulfobacteriota bacterium]